MVRPETVILKVFLSKQVQKKLVSMVIDDALAFGKPWVRMRRISSLVRALRFLARVDIKIAKDERTMLVAKISYQWVLEKIYPNFL